jgi:hypothetical protein
MYYQFKRSEVSVFSLHSALDWFCHLRTVFISLFSIKGLVSLPSRDVFTARFELNL